MTVVLKNSFIQTFFAIDSCMLMELPNDDKQGNIKRHHILLHFEEGKPFKMQLNLRHKVTHTHGHSVRKALTQRLLYAQSPTFNVNQYATGHQSGMQQIELCYIILLHPEQPAACSTNECTCCRARMKLRTFEAAHIKHFPTRDVCAAITPKSVL